MRFQGLQLAISGCLLRSWHVPLSSDEFDLHAVEADADGVFQGFQQGGCVWAAARLPPSGAEIEFAAVACSVLLIDKESDVEDAFTECQRLAEALRGIGDLLFFRCPAAHFYDVFLPFVLEFVRDVAAMV